MEEYVVAVAAENHRLDLQEEYPESVELSLQSSYEYEGYETEFNKKIQLSPAEIIEEDE